MHMKPHPNPHQAILVLEGGDGEAIHIYAMGKDLGISIQVDDSKTGVVIKTKRGVFREGIPDALGLGVVLHE